MIPNRSTEADLTNYKTETEHQHVLDLIFSQLPERQNRASSSWWFFLLFPESDEGYGPRQLMFTIAARTGDKIRITDVPLRGIDRKRPLEGGIDRFDATAVGWYCDGHKVYDEFIRHAGPAVLDFNEGTLTCPDGGPEGYNMTFSTPRDGRPTLRAEVCGPGGAAEFETWGELDAQISSPVVSMDITTPLGGTHYIGWRRLNFRGRFDLPTGPETLQGIGFFQRVCLNVPTFPWKWIWATFPDQTVFTAYVPYLGLNLFRKGYKFFKSNRLEQATLSLAQSAAWIPPGAVEPVKFNRMSATPVLNGGPHPEFQIAARNDAGDFINFTAAPYGLSRFYIDRPILGGLVESHWNYNEYMFRMEGLNGSVGGRPISRERNGQAYGSLEYTYGLGL